MIYGLLDLICHITTKYVRFKVYHHCTTFMYVLSLTTISAFEVFNDLWRWRRIQCGSHL